jgi:hypothetical protein
MKHFAVTLLVSYMLLAFAAAVPTSASVIDFEAQAANRDGNLTGIPDSPLTIGVATFAGGELLNGEVGLNADATGVYVSEGLCGSGETNPFVISFVVPVQNFTVLLLNGDDVRSYTVSDNLGDSATNSLASAGSLGGATFSLLGVGLTSVTITSANADGWDFAIDNVTFTATTTSTPEPGSMLLLGAGSMVLAVVIRRKRLNASLQK